MISQPLLFFKTINNVLNQSTYIQGIPNYNNPTVTEFQPTPDGVNFINLKNSSQVYFKLDRKDIINVSVEDQSTIENRVGFKRLLLVGLFALAWKKKKTNPLAFLIFEYKNDVGLNDEIYFQTESKDGMQFYNNVRYNLYKYWKECDEDPANIEQVKIETFAQFKTNKEAKSKATKNGCLIMIVLIVFFVLIVKMCSGGSNDSKASTPVSDSIATLVADSALASTDSASSNVKPLTAQEVKKQDAILEKDAAAERKNYQENLHNAFLDNNLDIGVKVYGKDNKTIKLTYILFNDVWTRKFETEDYLTQIRARGFTKIYLTDGYDYTRYWTFTD